MEPETAFEKQDLQIADLVVREGRALVYVITKWDRVKERNETLKSLKERAERLLPQARGAPMLTVSGLTGRGLDKLKPAVLALRKDWSAKVKTRDLNDWLAEAIARHPPPAVSGKRIKPRYIAQTKSRPPTFVLICSRASELPDAYRRYLINGIREAFDLPATPIRLIVRAGKNPYKDKE
jgi:GTP-binding protein